MAYSDITIIYNPNSTGGSKQAAKRLQRQLEKSLQKIPLTMLATTHAGHAESLAYEYAKGSARPLIISASGDGGYHEVITGVMRAQQEGFSATTGLVPTGNANDHFNALHQGNFIKNIISGSEQTIDILVLSGTTDGKLHTHYAHSYIGFGITPRIGKELNKTKLTLLKELWLAAKSFISFKYITVSIDSEPQRQRSLVCSNINRMAKSFAFTKESRVNDGKFEVSIMRHRNKFSFALALIKATLPGLPSSQQTTSFEFKTIEAPLDAQLDGEIVTLDADSKVEITIAPRALRCIV